MALFYIVVGNLREYTLKVCKKVYKILPTFPSLPFYPENKLVKIHLQKVIKCLGLTTFCIGSSKINIRGKTVENKTSNNKNGVFSQKPLNFKIQNSQ
jgi:hypothetical protein